MPRRNQGPRLVYLRKRAGYYVRWTERGRTRERSLATSDLQAAEAKFQAFLAGRASPAGPCDPAHFPIKEAIALYEQRAANTAAPERIGYAIGALAGFWAGNMVDDITEETCQAYARHRAKKPGTIRRELGVLRAANNYAVRRGRLTRAPFVWLPPKPDGKDRWLTRRELAALLRAARSSAKVRLHLPLFILLGVYTGARKETILSLRWPRVDFERGHIDLNPPGRARTSKGRPVIPIPRRLMTFLRLARRRGSETGFVVHRDGKPIRDVKVGFAAAAVRAGLCEEVHQERGAGAGYVWTPPCPGKRASPLCTPHPVHGQGS